MRNSKSLAIVEHYWWFYDSRLTDGGSAVLCLGWGCWPDAFPDDPPPPEDARGRWPSGLGAVDMGRRLQLPRGITMACLQVGGILCHQRLIFGLMFQVPAGDPMALLGSHSRLKGCVSKLTFDQQAAFRKQVAAIGLDVDQEHYDEFQEAYVPVDPVLAWKYAMKRGFKLVEGPFREGEEPKFLSPASLRLTSWAKVQSYLERSWERVDRAVDADGISMGIPEEFGGVVHVENCD